MGSDTITSSSSAMMMLDVPDPGPILTFRPDGTLELGAKYSWSDAARLLIQAYGNGITARIAELEAALSAATARAEAAERDSAKYRDYAAEKSNQYVQNLHELEMLKADFNDCNSERARHKAAREAAEAEAARLREAEMNAERFLANLDPENARDDSLLRDIHARLQRHGEKYPDRAVSVLHRNVVLYTIASVARAALGAGQ